MASISKRVRLYRQFIASSGWLPQKPLALLQAVWLGLLDAETLNEVTRSGYADQDAAGFGSEEGNLQGFWPWELDAVQTHFGGCRHVLVAGAGGGREAIALARLGFEVTAFDFCEGLNVACRRNLDKAQLTARVLDAPADRLPDGLGLFDGILVGRGFYHHIPGRNRRVMFLEQCRAHIKADAPLLLSDFFTRTEPSSGLQKIRSIANAVRRLRRCTERVALGDWLSESMQHAFVQAEIESELREARFRPETYSVSPLSDDSHLAHAMGRSLADRAI